MIESCMEIIHNEIEMDDEITPAGSLLVGGLRAMYDGRKTSGSYSVFVLRFLQLFS